MPPKRKAKGQAEPSVKKSKVKGAADVKADALVSEPPPATAQAFIIPPDEGSPYTLDTHKVHVTADGVIYDAALNQNNAQGGNNKFYRLQVLQDLKTGIFLTWTHWGRVGDHGQNAVLADVSTNPDHAMAAFEKKFKDKSGLKWENRDDKAKPGKYVRIHISYEPEDPNKSTAPAGNDNPEKEEVKVPDSSLALPVQQLIEFIFDQKFMKASMASLNYDVDKLPLGKLHPKTLNDGYETLKEIADILGQSQAVSAEQRAQIMQLSNLYFSYIPHIMKRGTGRQQQISSMEDVRRETDVLQALGYMVEANFIQTTSASESDKNPIDAKYGGLNCGITPVETKSKEFEEICGYLKGTTRAQHGMKLKVEDVFRVDRGKESERFEDSIYGRSKKPNRALLWHGSRSTNFGGILSQGLRIAPPEAPVSGYMFGKGIYLADMVSKSANYCRTEESGRYGLILLCEAELGGQLELYNNDYDAGTSAKEAKCWSTKGVGSAGPIAWKDAGCIHPDLKGVVMPDVAKGINEDVDPKYMLLHNEYICYDESQVCMRYLIRFQQT